MLKTMRMIQQAAPMPAMKAGCLTTSEICCDSGFSWPTDSVTRPEASEDVIGWESGIRRGVHVCVSGGGGGDRGTSAGANEDKAFKKNVGAEENKVEEHSCGFKKYLNS